MSGAETFGTMLRRLRMHTPAPGRQARGRARWDDPTCVSQRQVAQLAEIDAAYLNRLERGLANEPMREPCQPSRAIVESLATALNLSPIDRDRLLIAAGYWPWPDQVEDIERALSAVHGDFYSAWESTG